MLNKLILIACILFTSFGLFSFTYEWGIKYGAGVSSIHGKDLDYHLQYNFVNEDTEASSSLTLMSNKHKFGFAQNFGLFATFPLCSDVNTFLIQPEILWQRYSNYYWFKDVTPATDDLMLAGQFGGSVNGTVLSRMDYVTVPVLFKLQQGKPEDLKENRAIVSMFGYFGPSFSYLLDSNTYKKNDILDLDDQIQDFVDNPDNDYTYAEAETPLDNLIGLKYDLVLGFGWNLKDVIRAGCCKDEWVIDARFNLNLNALGDGDTDNNFKLYSALLSLGYKF